MSEKFELVSPDKQAEISGQIQNTEEIFSHGHQGVRYPLGSKEAYNEAVLNLASYSSNVAELSLNRRFHENLNLFEKMGLVSQGKQESHRRGVEIKKELIVAGVMAVGHALPYLQAEYQKRRENRKFRTNLVSWSAWIVEEENLAYRGKLENILKKIRFMTKGRCDPFLINTPGENCRSFPVLHWIIQNNFLRCLPTLAIREILNKINECVRLETKGSDCRNVT